MANGGKAYENGLLTVTGDELLADEGIYSALFKRLRSENEKLKAALRSGVEMRRRQKVYFKERTSERLVESKQSEASFDRLAAEALGEKK